MTSSCLQTVINKWVLWNMQQLISPAICYLLFEKRPLRFCHLIFFLKVFLWQLNVDFFRFILNKEVLRWKKICYNLLEDSYIEMTYFKLSSYIWILNDTSFLLHITPYQNKIIQNYLSPCDINKRSVMVVSEPQIVHWNLPRISFSRTRELSTNR